MAHDRDAAANEIIHRLRHFDAALQLHRRTAGLRHDAGGAAEGKLRRFLVADEGHVDDETGAPAATMYRGTMGDHHVEGDLEGAVESIQHHAQGIAHQQQIDMGIELAGHRRRIGGEADDGFATLARGEIRY